MRLRNTRRTERGQSLIVAVIVMFVLLFVGGLFVGLVARNLLNSGRAVDTTAAEEIARAGIQHASWFLENSPEGADWRPAPTPPANLNDPDRRWLEAGYTRVEIGRGRALIRVSMKPDPRAPLGKYIKIESVGRAGFLNPNDPTTFLNTPAPRLRRELVAYKAIGLTDYLRFVTNRFNDTKFEAALGVPPLSIPPALIARQNDPTIPEVPLAMQLGKMPVRALGGVNFADYQTPGAPIRVNGNLRLMGNLILAVDPRNREAVHVAGKIIVDDQTNRPLFIDATGTATPLTGSTIFGSDEAGYTTFAGLLRDSGPNPDSFGFARAISRLEPPLIDVEDQATGTTRYRLSTRESGRFLVDPNGRRINTGAIGLGAGLYIDNFGDRERETESVQGAQSLRSIWLQPGSNANWRGTYYIPPGVSIDFGYPVVQERDANGNLVTDSFVPRAGFRALRNDRRFTDPNDNIAPAEMPFTWFIYKPLGRRPVLKLENEFFRTYLRTAQNMTEQEIDRWLPEWNGVIYAEGNVRVRGLLPGKWRDLDNDGTLDPGEPTIPIRREAGSDPDNLTDAQILERVNPPAVTVVSGATIYVEGSLVRERPDSMIGLLAEDYVTVNTTLFMGPNKTINPAPTNADGQAPFHVTVDIAESSATPPFALEFLFGDDPTGYTPSPGQAATGLNLLLRSVKLPQAMTYLSLFVNPALSDPNNNISALYRFNSNAAPFSYPTPNNPPPTVHILDNLLNDNQTFEQREFPLLPAPHNSTYVLFTEPGLLNTLRPAAIDPIQAEQPFLYTDPGQSYLFGGAAIVPMDVRIEAVIYAQDGSFFIIPGYSFNPDPSDTRDAALRRAQALQLPPGTMVRPEGTSPFYPFYGEPIDCRITVVGSITENRTASIADQAAWMQLWGYIPERYGSTGSEPGGGPGTAQVVPDEHRKVGEVGLTVAADPDLRTQAEQDAGITRGLRFLYDPALSAPYPGYNPDSGTFVTAGSGNWFHTDGGGFRQDDYGRILPPLPRLPVCPGFVFYGEVR